MGRPERPIDPGQGPVSAFAHDLRRLRQAAGSPSYRELARLAHFSATALSAAASGASLPSLAVTLAYVRACGGDVADWEERWTEVSGSTTSTVPGVVPAAGSRDPVAAQAAAQISLGHLSWALRRHHDAIDHYTAAIELARHS